MATAQPGSPDGAAPYAAWKEGFPAFCWYTRWCNWCLVTSAHSVKGDALSWVLRNTPWRGPSCAIPASSVFVLTDASVLECSSFFGRSVGSRFSLLKYKTEQQCFFSSNILFFSYGEGVAESQVLLLDSSDSGVSSIALLNLAGNPQCGASAHLFSLRAPHIWGEQGGKPESLEMAP